MADIVIDAGVNSASASGHQRTTVMVSTLVGYQFFVESDSDLMYTKTTDGGATWGTPVDVRAGTIDRYDVWFDKWTPGDSGTLIHCFYVDSVIDDALYRTLDTNGDSLGTERTIFAGASVATGTVISGAKARGGNMLCCFNLDGGTEIGTYRSTDGGVNWTARAEAVEAAADIFHVLPGNESDTQDFWIIFHDDSADELSLKVYDDSANSIDETSIATGMLVSPASTTCYAASIRHSDNHLILVAWNDYDTSTADLQAWDINGAGSITAKTNVVTNSDDALNCCVFIDQNTGDIYVGYNGKSDGSETQGTSVHAYYKKSTDGGGSWGSETVLSASSNNKRRLWSDLGGTSSRFMPVWYVSAGPSIETNKDNSVAISPPAGGSNLVYASMVT